MKLSLTYKNATLEAISADLKEELDQAVEEANRMLLDWVGVAAIVARPLAVVIVEARDLYSQLTTEKVEEPIFVAAQVPPEDGYVRLVFLMDNGRGCVDVLIEEA
jgi:hypothetical protein